MNRRREHRLLSERASLALNHTQTHTNLTMRKLADSILALHKEHMKNEDIEGFAWDLAILINEGLTDGFDDDEMTAHVHEYIKEFIEVSRED